MKISRKEISELFNLAQVEERNEQLRLQAARNEQKTARQKAVLLEYMIEHLKPTALIAVHQTNHFPRKGVLKPTGHFLLNLFSAPAAQKIISDLQLRHPRITIHFTLNYPVEGVAAGGQWVTWEGKYGILIPVKDFVNRIKCLNPVDTWIIGELKLPASAEIVMPEREYNLNPKSWGILAGKATVIPYPSGHTIHQALRERIQMKGYRLASGGDHGWFEGQDLQYLYEFIKKSEFLSLEEKQQLLATAAKNGYTHWNQIFQAMAEKIGASTTPHWKTLWREMEVFAEEVYGLILDPTEEEKQELAIKIGNRLIGASLFKLRGQARSYWEKVIAEKKKRKYISSEEKKSLGLLIRELKKIEVWLSDLLEKIKISSDLTWGEFLQTELK